MARLEIVKIGRNVLRNKGDLVSEAECRDDAMKRFLKDMVDTMHHAHGVGLAANQVGVGKQAIVLECRVKDRYPDSEDIPLQTYLNPKIIHYSKETEDDWEGCLSIPGYRGRVPRSLSITFQASTPDGERIEKTIHGFHARIIQHEVDHINGLFYMDRMPDLMQWYHLDEFNKEYDMNIKDRT